MKHRAAGIRRPEGFSAHPVNFEIDSTLLPSLKADIQQALEDLKLDEHVSME